MAPCEVDGCDRPATHRAWCASHYRRWRRTGDVSPERLLPGNLPARPPLPDGDGDYRRGLSEEQWGHYADRTLTKIFEVVLREHPEWLKEAADRVKKQEREQSEGRGSAA